MLFAFSRVFLIGCQLHSVLPHLRIKRTFIIVGTGSRAIDVCREMRSNPHFDYRLMGYIDSDPQTEYVSEYDVLGSIEDFRIDSHASGRRRSRHRAPDEVSIRDDWRHRRNL